MTNPFGGSIGPRLPLFDGEACQCGGYLVFDRNEGDKSIWKCGQCNKQKTGPATKPSNQNTLTREDIMEEDIIVETEKDKKKKD